MESLHLARSIAGQTERESKRTGESQRERERGNTHEEATQIHQNARRDGQLVGAEGEREAQGVARDVAADVDRHTTTHT